LADGEFDSALDFAGQKAEFAGESERLVMAALKLRQQLQKYLS
jgi:hypothetical protein